MYKIAARWLIRRNIARLNRGDTAPTTAMFADDATLSFPGHNAFAEQFRPVQKGRQAHITHRGRAEIEEFVQRYADAGIQMVIEDILVNGPPWNTRIAVRTHVWVDGGEGSDLYNNRAVLFARSAWGKITSQEDYEDTERAAAYAAATQP